MYIVYQVNIQYIINQKALCISIFAGRLLCRMARKRERDQQCT